MFSSRTQWLLALGLLTVTPCQGRAVEDIQKRAGDLQARASATINVGPIITAAAMAACSSGTISNPTADNWNNFQVSETRPAYEYYKKVISISC